VLSDLAPCPKLAKNAIALARQGRGDPRARRRSARKLAEKNASSPLIETKKAAGVRQRRSGSGGIFPANFFLFWSTIRGEGRATPGDRCDLPRWFKIFGYGPAAGAAAAVDAGLRFFFCFRDSAVARKAEDAQLIPVWELKHGNVEVERKTIFDFFHPCYDRRVAHFSRLRRNRFKVSVGALQGDYLLPAFTQINPGQGSARSSEKLMVAMGA